MANLTRMAITRMAITLNHSDGHYSDGSVRLLAFRLPSGVLAMAGCEERYVYQGVHMLFTGETLKPWGDAPRVNRLIFIGKNLDRDALRQGFESCLVAK